MNVKLDRLTPDPGVFEGSCKSLFQSLFVAFLCSITPVKNAGTNVSYLHIFMFSVKLYSVVNVIFYNRRVTWTIFLRSG